MNAWTSVLAAYVVSDRTNGRNCLSWKNPDRQSEVTWADIAPGLSAVQHAALVLIINNHDTRSRETGANWNTVLFQARKWGARDWNDDSWLVHDNCLRFSMISCFNLIANSSSTSLSAMFIFGARNFIADDAYGMTNRRRKPAPVNLWRRFLESVSWV